MPRQLNIWATLAVVLLSTIPMARAEKIAAEATALATIHDGQGHSRFLLQLLPSLEEEYVAIQRAVLSFPLTGEAESRTLSLRVHPISTPWSASDVSWESGWSTPGGDFDVDIVNATDVDLSRSGTTVSIDVLDILKETFEEGRPFHGFLVTADPSQGQGLSDADAAGLSGLASATLALSYRRVPAPPPGIAAVDSIDAR